MVTSCGAIRVNVAVSLTEAATFNITDSAAAEVCACALGNVAFIILAPCGFINDALILQESFDCVFLPLTAIFISHSFRHVEHGWVTYL